MHAFEGRTIKGEITLVLAGKKEEAVELDPEASIKERFDLLSAQGNVTRRDLVESIAADLALPRKLVYDTVHRLCKE